MSGIKEDRYNLSSLSFEDKVFDVMSIVQEFHVITKQGKKIRKIWPLKPINAGSTFITTYLDPSHVCVTKAENSGNGHLLRSDFVALNVKQLLIGLTNADILIYVHQKGRLLKKLGSPNFVFENKNLRQEKEKNKRGFSYNIDLRINTVEVLKKREDAVTPCNSSLHDEDTQWINNAVNVLGCLPPFLKPFVSKSTLSKNVANSLVCTMDQYSKFNLNYSPEHHFGKIAEFYEQPCSYMTIGSTLTNTLTPKIFSAGIDLNLAGTITGIFEVGMKIEYLTEEYKLETNIGL